MDLLVRSIYKIKSPVWFRDRSSEGDIYEHYMKMHDISLRSFEKHLQGDWQFKFYNEEVEDIQQVFKDHFFKLYDLWCEGHNILYCGPDNIMLKPTEIFGKYEDFMMFNYTDPKKSVEANKWNIQHEHFLNADVRYYPQTMSHDIWDIGLKMAEEWDFDCWNTEQVILNHMLWSQHNRVPENTIDAVIAYQGQDLYIDQWEQRKQHANTWNGCELRDAHIVHLHGSRNAPEKLRLMKELEKHV